jgi:hypothetical protein
VRGQKSLNSQKQNYFQGEEDEHMEDARDTQAKVTKAVLLSSFNE